jgi:hypothetical protein
MSDSFLAVGELDQIAGGLNIEGGFPAHELVKTCGFQLDQTLWANFILVLDRPLIDQVIFDKIVQIKNDNNYPLLENAIEEINECHFMVAFYMVISHYLNHGHKLTGVPLTNQLNVTIHVHQDRNCQPLIEIIQKMVTDILSKSMMQNAQINVTYRSDNPSYADAKTDKNYENTHILLSLSQCAGLDAQYATGSLLLSDTFVPYDIENREIKLSDSYQVKNDLVDRIGEIIISVANQEAVDWVKHNYRSANPLKLLRDRPRVLTLHDFPQTQILQVNQLWNPSTPKELVLVHSKSSEN